MRGEESWIKVGGGPWAIKAPITTNMTPDHSHIYISGCIFLWPFLLTYLVNMEIAEPATPKNLIRCVAKSPPLLGLM